MDKVKPNPADRRHWDPDADVLDFVDEFADADYKADMAEKFQNILLRVDNDP